MEDQYISYEEARQLTLAHTPVLPSETVTLLELVGRVTAEPLYAKVDSPSVDASLKDGYAVRSADIARAAAAAPVRLRLIGHAAAGNPWSGTVLPETAVRILTGAQIPQGADAVLAEEFVLAEEDSVLVTRDAAPGYNILPRGCDIEMGQQLLPAGIRLRPPQVGLLAAAGWTEVRVVQQPRVAIIATGDEVIAPGMPPQPGKLFASNLVTLASWCVQYGMQVTTSVVADDATSIEAELLRAAGAHDALITSGGAWKGEHDLVVGILDRLGWTRLYHHVRLGPGKAAGMGLLDGKPVFCLPGGPPSNHAAFLELALPGLLTLGGQREPDLPTLIVELAEDLRGQIDWTQCIHGRFERLPDLIRFHSLKPVSSRLQMMAEAEGIVLIPEGVAHLPAGARVLAQILA